MKLSLPAIGTGHRQRGPAKTWTDGANSGRMRAVNNPLMN
jgi:hypothetical protein